MPNKILTIDKLVKRSWSLKNCIKRVKMKTIIRLKNKNAKIELKYQIETL